MNAYLLTLTGAAWNRVANAHPHTVPAYAKPWERRRFDASTASAVLLYRNELLAQGLGVEEW